MNRRAASIETVQGVLVDGPVRVRFTEDTKTWMLDSFTARYLRICAVYRLLRARRIDKARAVELLMALKHRNGSTRIFNALALVEIWLAGPLRAAA